MKRGLTVGLLSGWLVATVLGAGAVAEPLSKPDVVRWTRHLVPLPRDIEFKGAVISPADQVAISAPPDAEPLVRQAVKELRECLGLEAAAPAKATFTIRLRVEPKDAGIGKLPHADQAYTIRPDGQAALVLTGGGPRGAYYAAKTVQQLLRAFAAEGKVRVPLVTITDWPDIEDRGFWGADTYYRLRWMSDRKLNYDEQIARNGVDGQKRCFVDLSGGKRKIIDEGPTYGINPVPVVLHLEQLSGSGLFEAYPELKGKDGREGTICYSNPKFVDILAEWLVQWRDLPGVTEVDVWMAENLAGQKGCQCEGCIKEDRSVLEARTIVAAWTKARQTRPDLGLRVLTSEETEKANPRVIAELPKEVKLWYYHSLFTYNAREKPMIPPYLVDAIQEGRWVGVCPNICGIVGTFQPFTCPQFIHYRMGEFVDKKLSGLLGYPVPGIAHTRLNAEAAAEWTWNLAGRSPREFAVSYAVRQGYSDPEKFADWCEANGPVAWDVYGSEWPSGEKRKRPGKLADLLREGKLPELGSVLFSAFPIPWGDIKTVQQLDRDVSEANRAVQLAREIGVEEYVQESLVIQGYIQAIHALWQLKQVVKPDGVAAADKPAARRWFKAYVDSLDQAKAALPAWEKALPTRASSDHYTRGAVEIVTKMIAGMKSLAVDLGCGP
ncbi:MAG: hypothetical protein HY718_04340 [Planctomycetes bacterium]|nr:hypothetical protein [Planctomycetota bacterium]